MLPPGIGVASECAAGTVAKGVITNLLNDISMCVSKRSRAAKLIGEEIKRDAIDRLPHLVIDAWAI